MHNIESALIMEVEGDYYGEVEATLVELGATGLMTQESKPGRTMVFDACNGFNELIRLAMLWTVWHHCLEGERFVSISISIGRSFYSASPEICQLHCYPGRGLIRDNPS